MRLQSFPKPTRRRRLPARKRQYVDYPDGRASAICLVSDCGKPVLARGWCEAHYKRWKAWGDPLGQTNRQKNRLSVLLLPCPVVEYEKVCGQPQKSKGLCKKHYERQRNTGEVVNQYRERGTPEERFLQLVGKPSDGGCRLWIGRIDPRGYGRFDYEGRPRLAHHFAWFLEYGRWPTRGLTLDHECHNRDLSCWAGDHCLHRSCTEITHLVEKSLSENVHAALHRRSQLSV